jgi:hypothetical protein
VKEDTCAEAIRTDVVLDHLPVVGVRYRYDFESPSSARVATIYYILYTICCILFSFKDRNIGH